MPILDLDPATSRLAALINGLDQDQFDAPTPCLDYRLGDLVDHVGGFALAFTAGARKEASEAAAGAPTGGAKQRRDDWQVHIPLDLAELAKAWTDADAWTGMTRVAGIDLPGESAGLFALDEAVIHGWDVAKASGQPFDCESELLEALHGFVEQLAAPDQQAPREGLFGPVVDVANDAPLLDRVLGLTGRDPSWSA